MFDVCRYVKEEWFANEEELKKMFGTSFDEAKKLKYLSSDNKEYQITDLGLEYLGQYKVDNAIIVASGFGSRFIPFTYDMPHGLLEVRGEALVERQIKQLKAVGIKDIIIVVGYLGDQFKYLVDKYDVELIKNPNHKEYDMLSGLKLVKDKLKSTYLLTADLYLGEGVVHENEKDSWYGAMFNEVLSKSNYPAFDEAGRFIGIKAREPRHQWILKGPIFLNEEASNLIKEDLKDSVIDFNAFFSEVLKKTSMELLAVKAHDVFVLDTLEALRAFDRSYLSPGKHEALDLIAHVFKVKQDQIFDITMMKEGMTNDSFLFTVDNRRYVFRVPGKGTEVLIAREQEALVYDVIKDLEISDEIVYMDPVSGYKITRYYEDIRNLDVTNMDEVEKAIDMVRMLHDKNIKVPHSFDLKERTYFYKEHCDDVNAKYYDGFDEVFPRIESLFDHLDTLDRPHLLCHIDPIGDNFLVLDDGSLRLIDWEYAGMSDPLADISMLSIFSEYDDEKADQVFDLYTEGKGSKEERFVYYAYIAISSFMWTLWTNYKEALGEDYGDYGLKQFEYSKRYSIKALDMKDEFDG